MDHSVFISYSSADKASADQVCAYLEASGIGCWIAPRDIPPGVEYPAAILDGLAQARTIVLLVSPAAVQSPHILSEVGHAFSKKKPIIPLRLAAIKLPPDFDYFLSMSQRLDALDGCTPANLARLKDAVSQASSGPGPVRGEVRKRSRMIIAACALFMVIAGLVFWRSIGNRPRPEDPPVVTASGSGVPTAPKASKPQPWVNPKDGLTYVWIPPGQFMMGCSAGDTECKPDEAPSHLVEIPAGFWIGQTEVTNAAYQKLVPSAKFQADESKLPVVGLSWAQAKAYCAAAGGRLPAEAEWEYAARAGSANAYYGVPSRIAWYEANSGGVLHEVGVKEPNAFGLFDVLGNASEWVLDRYYNRYDLEAPAIGDVQQPLAGNASALTRGGFWESEAANIRVSHRIPMDNQDRAPMAGVRCIAERK